ncbi:TonB-dependent receptor plug domain protein [Selenomonas sp. FOBRC9]|uniref:TonB-dependent receptor plug domain-containing protein n=1 Tax=Selenomonas sp. FOBRC9 TaxID=936573 RepID=UPI00027A44B3|nr:TonB-dependent receptor [Selenomonas sp. FOBRC9]EJP33240.1 TonB-dependent receptor plug domain protein [Selenomonas sp. FOBRC9]
MNKKSAYRLALAAAVTAGLGFAFLPQAQAASTVEPYETGDVVVEADGVDKYLVTTNTITAEEIKDRGYRDLSEILSQVPGLYMAPADKNSKMVRIRGAAADQTKVYIDGVPTFPLTGIASNAAADLSTIPADSIAKVEIIKGPGPVRYGTDYKGGVILVTTKDGEGAGRLHLHLGGGSHHAYDMRIGYSGSDRNVSYAVNVSRRHTNGYQPNEENTKTYFDGKIKVKTAEKSTLTLSGYYSNMDAEIANNIDPVTGAVLNNGTNWSVAAGNGITRPMKQNNKTRDWHYDGFKQSNIALQFESRPSDKWQYDVQYYHLVDDNNLWVRNLLTREGGSLTHFTAGAPQWYRSGWFSKGNGIETNASAALGAKHQLGFGAKYIKIDWHTDENNTGYSERGADKRQAFYVEDAWSFDARTRMTLGLRYESVAQDHASSSETKQESKEHATDPVLNITHDLTKDDTVRFSAGRTHFFVQAKSAATNIRQGIPIPKPERNRNYEIGWKHRFGSQASLDLSIFRTDVTDRITRIVRGGPYYNVDRTRIRGLELGYRQTFSSRWHGFANYTWMKAEDITGGNTTDATGLPKQMFNLGATYRMGKWRSTLLGRAVSGWTNGSGRPNSKGYLTMDLDLRYRPQTDLECFLRVNNIFNTDYQDKLYHDAQGANVMLGVEMDF